MNAHVPPNHAAWLGQKWKLYYFHFNKTSLTAWWCTFWPIEVVSNTTGIGGLMSQRRSISTSVEEQPTRKKKHKKDLRAVSRPSELIWNQQQHGGSSSQVPAVYWKEMRKHLESPRWDCDADRLAPPRPTRLIYKVIGFIWWLLVLPRLADGSTPGSVSFCVSASWRQLSLCTAEAPHT